MHPQASIDNTAFVGPYCCVEEGVTLQKHVRLVSHVSVAGHTTIGAHTTVYPFASLGHIPQDLKYKGEPSSLTIGTHNVIREHVTMNPGTESGGMTTTIGHHGLYMVGCHIAHDCRIGDNVIIANNATLGGHVYVEDHVVIGGLAAIHQFVRIGQHAVIGGALGVERDVLPYGSVIGPRGNLAGLNMVGLKRHGFSHEDRHTLRETFRLLTMEYQGSLVQRVQQLPQNLLDDKNVQNMIAFIQGNSHRDFSLPLS